jgi:hypothetical protein
LSKVNDCATLPNCEVYLDVEEIMRGASGIRRSFIAFVLITLISLTSLNSAQARPDQQGQDIAQITSPTEGQAISGLVTVTGTADQVQFDRWELAYGTDPNPNDTWQPFASGKAPVLNGTIGTWNTAVIPDGTYMLRLRAVRKDSNFSEMIVRGLQVSNSGPVGTPTSIPPASTFPAEQPTFSPAELAQPTKQIVIEQPPTSIPAPTAAGNATPTPAARRSNTASGSIFSSELIGSTCLSGVVLTVTVFAAVGLIQFGRYGYRQIRRQVRKK